MPRTTISGFGRERAHDVDNIAEPLIRYRVALGGQTLARRWEQLYYVFLAQAADDVDSLDEARRRAEAALSKVDRAAFLAHAGLSTVAELVKLHRWEDARMRRGRVLRKPVRVRSR